jgi:hypothetical protein
MKIEKGKVELKNEFESVMLATTDIKHDNHKVFEATKQGYKLFVYNDNDNWEIFDKGNCIGEQGIIKQWEIMKVLNG